MKQFIEFAKKNGLRFEDYSGTEITFSDIMLFKNDVFVDITQKNDTFDVRVEKGIGEKYDVLYEAHFIKEQFVFETIKEYLLKDNI